MVARTVVTLTPWSYNIVMDRQRKVYSEKAKGENCAQFSSVAQLCLILCDPMDCSTPGFLIHHQLPELAQTNVGDAIHHPPTNRVGDAIHHLILCHPLLLLPPIPPSIRLFSMSQLFATPWTAALQASLSITNSRSLPKFMSMSWWCYPTISSSVIPFSSYPQSFPASGYFHMSQLFASGGQSIEVSALASVLPMNIQDWFPLWWTGLISFQSKGLSRVFSNTTVQEHQFFGTQLSLQSSSHIHTWLLEKPSLWLDRPLLATNVSAF